MPYSQEAADRVIKFVKLLKHTKAPWAGVPFNLQPWQEHRILRPLFGTLNDDGTRQYRTAYISFARKNGKSELGAAMALYLLFADGEVGAEIYSAAADRDQAAIVFNVAAQMVRQNPALMKRCKIIDSQKRIVVHSTNSFYRVLSSEAHTKHGFNPSAVIYDELHAAPNRELWDVLTTGSGTRRQPLFVAITTAGYDRHSICYEQYDYAKKVEQGIIEDPTFFSCIYEIDPSDDWTDEAVWQKANPALGDFLRIDEMQAAAKKAQAVPAVENTFKRLRLNMWTEQETRWLPMATWDACDVTVKPVNLTGRRCYAGLDLSSTTDITALVLVFPPGPDDDGVYSLVPYFWIPEESMRQRAERDRVPYDEWARQKLIHTTPGNVIDYDYILQTIDEAAQQFDIAEVAYDRWGATQLSIRLEEQGMTVVPMGQGFASMSGPTKEFEKLVLAHKLAHGNNPVLRWMASNAVVRQDPAGNLKPDKSKSTERIDGIVAAVMALDRALRHQEKPEPRGVVVL